MGKREFTAFTDSFLKRAGQEYMSMQQIDNLKRQEKSAKENLDYQKKRHKEDTELDIAKLIVAARQKETEVEAPLTGAERLQDVQADVLETRVEELDKLRAEGKISPQDYIDKLSMYSSYKRTHVTGMPEGGGAGGAKAATESQWLTALRGNEDDRRAIVDKMRGSIDMDSKLQVAVDATAEFEKAETYEDLKDAYDKVIARLDAIAKEGEIQLPLVDASKNDLARYKILAQDRIWYNAKLGRTSGAQTQAKPVTKKEIAKEELNGFKTAVESGDTEKVNEWLGIFKERGYTDDEIRGL